MIAPFYIGQKVVAVKDHSRKIFKKGDEFTVLNVLRACKCGVWFVDIGIAGVSRVGRCSDCGRDIPNGSDAWLIAASMFAPITSTFQSISFIEVVKEESKLVSAN